MRSLDRKQRLVYYEGTNGDAPPADESEALLVPAPAIIAGGLRLTVDLHGPDIDSVVAYEAKRKTPPIDLSKVGFYDPAVYWERLTSPKSRRLVLEPGDFYLLASKERLSVPHDHAAEMGAIRSVVG